MDQAGVTSEKAGVPRPVFLSYASANRKRALDVCRAVEGRGIDCWIASRDVAPGENYQDAIVKALRAAPAMVLIFSRAANSSEEIKKELSLASRFNIPVIALRIEDVEPSDAFAYELSTRQWIDAFAGWDKAINAVAARIGQIAGSEPVAPLPAGRRRLPLGRGSLVLAIGLFAVIAAGLWWWLRPQSGAAHSMTVRLAGFQSLSADLPATVGQALDAEIAAAFNADGVVAVSTASAPAPGKAPAYALGGTIQRIDGKVRVITRLANERSGTTLWTNTFNYEDAELKDVPRHIAVDAGNVVRCGLFGADTYRKPLPDAVLKDYLHFCQGHWALDMAEGRKALIPAQRVVAAVPKFSWGWAGVAGAYWKVAEAADDEKLAAEARAKGIEAADRALAIDDMNSEALWIRSLLIDARDWSGREKLLQRAVATRRLDCGCEHHQYGYLLLNVGRVTEAVDQFRQAEDMLALYVYTSLNLAEALVASAEVEEAKAQFEKTRGLAPDLQFAEWLTIYGAAATGDVQRLTDPHLTSQPELRTALVAGFRAIASGNAGAKRQAIGALLALPEQQQNVSVARLVAKLGAGTDALHIAGRLATRKFPGPSVFWYPEMRPVLNDPAFPALADQLGLMRYWRTSRGRPDVCRVQGAPSFCRTI